MQPPSPARFYSRYPAATMLSHSSAPHSNPPPPSYVYSQYPSPYPSVTYSTYLTPQHSFVPTQHSLHVQPPPVISSPPIYPPHPTTAPPSNPAPSAYPPPSPEACERDAFYRKLHAFRDAMGEPIQRLPTLGFKELDLWVLYREVIKRRGIDSVIANKQWKEIAEALQLPSSCTDSGFRLRLHYKKYLEAFERKFYQPPEPLTPRPTTPAIREAATPSHSPQPPTATLPKPKKPSATKEKKELISPGTSSGSDETRAGSTGTESNGSGSGSRRSTGGTSGVGRTEATSKARAVVVKKKKRVPAAPSHSADLTHVGTEDDDSDEPGRKDGDVPHCGNTKAAAPEAGGKADEARVRKRARPGDATSSGSSSSVGAGVEAMARKRRARQVDFSVLGGETLQRYARVHGVSGEGRLAERVGAHFSRTPLRDGETATLLKFIQMVRRR